MGNPRRTTPREHGTQACYVFGEWGGDSKNGCRCDLCKAENRRLYRARKARIEPAYVGADRAREHVTWLATQGVGLKQVAKVSGVSQGSLWKLMYGKRQPNGTQVPSKRITRATEQAILNVMPSQGADGSRVDAAETWRHINTLLQRGWTKCAINRALGNTSQGLQVRKDMVERGTARKIKALLDEPVPEDVGKAWSAHHRAVTEEPGEEPVVRWDKRDNVTLRLVELLEERIEQNHWRRDAACRGRPPWMFFPARGDHKALAAAKKVCGACFVRDQCLVANVDERNGVYGGLSAHERRELRAGVAS